MRLSTPVYWLAASGLPATAVASSQWRLVDKGTVSSSPLLSLHRDLIEIESITGNEYRVGKYLKEYLTDHNFTVETQLVEPLDLLQHGKQPPRYNILAYPGESRRTRILVSSHIDTVPPFWPYQVRDHHEIWGRGSVDAKGCVATQITAVRELLASGDIGTGDVSFLFVVGEEIGGDGMRKANDLGLIWETVIFGEPTELKLASGHKGTIGFSVKAKGKAGHSGYPWLGESANSMILPALMALDQMELPSSKKYGNSTLNIGRMEGGVAGNVIAEKAEADVQLRLAAGTAEEAKKAILQVVNTIDDRLEVNFHGKGYGPVYIDSDVQGRRSLSLFYYHAYFRMATRPPLDLSKLYEQWWRLMGVQITERTTRVSHFLGPPPQPLSLTAH